MKRSLGAVCLIVLTAAQTIQMPLSLLQTMNICLIATLRNSMPAMDSHHAVCKSGVLIATKQVTNTSNTSESNQIYQVLFCFLSVSCSNDKMSLSNYGSDCFCDCNKSRRPSLVYTKITISSPYLWVFHLILQIHFFLALVKSCSISSILCVSHIHVSLNTKGKLHEFAHCIYMLHIEFVSQRLTFPVTKTNQATSQTTPVDTSTSTGRHIDASYYVQFHDQ